MTVGGKTLAHQRELYATHIRALIDMGHAVSLDDVLQTLERGSLRADLTEQIMFARLRQERDRRERVQLASAVRRTYGGDDAG